MSLRRASSFVRWQAHLARLWSRGGDDRHLALAHWRGERLRRRLSQIVASAGRDVVLVGLVEHFGDIVAAEPAFRAIRKSHPEALIVHVVRRPWRVLTAEHPDVDRQETVDCLSEWYLAGHRAGAAAVYDLHIPGRVCDRCRSVTRQIPAAAQGIDMTNYYEHGSLLDAFCRVGGVELGEIDPGPRLHVAAPRLPGQGLESVGGPGAPYVVIHARSNQARRDWTDAGWEALIAALWQEGLPVAEVGLRPTLKQAGAADLTGLTVEGTIDVIRHAALFIGIDSGPAHVANALGTPAVVLLGRYGKYERRMPFSGPLRDGGGGVVIQHAGAMEELGPQRVIEAARAVLARREMPAEAATP
jgi:ADP-heptose:LPS heptosyltransferase